MEVKLRVSKVLVTGGGSGIGLAIAKALLREGCHVCICGRNLEKLEKRQEEIGDEKLSVMQWDIRDVSIAREKFNEAACLCGGYLDGLVNNAGVYTTPFGWAPWHESEEVWDSVWDTNLKAQIFLLRRFTTYLHQNKSKGNIFCVSSIVGNSCTAIDSYTASKLAYTRMVRSHARMVLEMGIVINGILPGITASSINQWAKNMKPGDRVEGCAIKRVLAPEEIADCAMFMMSDRALICCGEMLDASGGIYNAV